MKAILYTLPGLVGLMAAGVIMSTTVAGADPEAGDGDRPATWLGIGTRPVPKLVGEHLGLAPGSGLAVEVVAPDSPAAQAGLQQHDVLIRLQDQILYNHDQLAALLQSYAPGGKVKLSIMREEEPMEVEATLGERPDDLPVVAGRRPWNGPELPGLGLADPDLDELFQFGPGMMGGDELQKRLNELRERLQNMRVEMDMNLKADPDAGVQMKIFRFDDARMHIKDCDGSITIEKKDGKAVLTAKDKDGKVIFEGPYETPEDKAKVPEEVRRRADRIQMKGDLFQGIFPPPDDGPEIDGDLRPGDKVD